tara:strand:+ start:223 stop:417 length:195 start_codon:yes stop_codon:yes gene_type:complete
MSKTKEKDDTLYVAASEVTKYLEELKSVLLAIASGLDESKEALIQKSEDAKAETKGEANDGAED